MRNSARFPLSILLSALLYSCTGEPDRGINLTSSSSDTTVTGLIHGQVSALIANRLSKLSLPLSTVRVEVDSTSYFTYSDDSGHFLLPAPTGRRHTLRFSKEGYGEMKIFNIPFAAPGEIILPDVIRLSEVPTYQFVQIEQVDQAPYDPIIITAKQKLVVLENASPTTRTASTCLFRFYTSDPTLPTKEKPRHTLTTEVFMTPDSIGIPTFTYPLSRYQLRYVAKLPIDQAIYMTLTASNLDRNGEPLLGEYIDPVLNELHYTSVGPESEPIIIRLQK